MLPHSVETVKTSPSLPLPLPARIAFRGLARNLHWTDDIKDLLEVATAVLLADRLVARPKSGRNARRIQIALRVRNPQKWRAATASLRDVLAVLTEDHFSFQFTRGTSTNIPFPNEAPQNRLTHLRQVALFSGGLDSAAAAALFSQQGVQTAYVTHYTRDIHRISRLLRSIHNTYGGSSEVPHAWFYVRPAGLIVSQLRENSRRTRSFLFVSLAVATAMGLTIDDVCVCENGPLALNLPLSAAMVPTKHAHSQFLRAMEEFVQHIFEKRIRISNPFELLTKGQMSRILKSNPRIALATVSCWNQQWSGTSANFSHGHCGFCVPCLVRRVSLEAAGIPLPRHHFDTNARSLARVRYPSRKNVRRLVPYRAILSFAVRVQECKTWREFVRSFPPVIDSQSTCGAMVSDLWFQNLFRMTRTFAREIIESLGDD